MIAVVLLAGSSLHPSGSAPALSGLATHPVLLTVIACFLLAALALGLRTGGRRWRACAHGAGLLHRALASRLRRSGSLLEARGVGASPWLRVRISRRLPRSGRSLDGPRSRCRAERRRLCPAASRERGHATGRDRSRARRQHQRRQRFSGSASACRSRPRWPTCFSVRRRSLWSRVAKTCAMRSGLCGFGAAHRPSPDRVQATFTTRSAGECMDTLMTSTIRCDVSLDASRRAVTLPSRTDRATRAVVALDGVNVEFAVSETVALWGPSGSGKTTLLHALGGLVEPTRGVVLWNGEPLSSLDPRPAHRHAPAGSPTSSRGRTSSRVHGVRERRLRRVRIR